MPKRKVVVLSVLGALFIGLTVFFSNLSRHYVVPILMYHSVTAEAKTKNPLAVTAKTFSRQMRFLKEHHYNVLPLEAIVELMKEKKKVPLQTVALTFDDGYQNVYDSVFPILRKYNLPAAVFVIVNEVGRPQGDRLRWDEIKAMQDSGLVSVGSHCLGPEPLVNLKSEELIRKEIFDSKRILEERLGRAVSLFSYPEGLFNDKIRHLVIEAGYQLAVATKPGRDYPNDDIFALKRLRISENSANLFIFAVETSGYYTWMKEKKRKK